MPLSTWLYISTSLLSTLEADTELEFIISTSRARNHGLDVTGALLFTGYRFVQLLEGPAESIDVLRHSIAGDCRHVDLVNVPAAPLARRQFTRWSLAYAGPSPLVSKVVESMIPSAGKTPVRSAEDLILLLSKFSPLA